MDDLKRLRDEIDRLDEQIVSLISERVEVSKKIGLIKKEDRKPIKDNKREQEVLDHVHQVARSPVLQEKIEDFYQLIMNESKIEQKFFNLSSSPFKKIGIIGLGLMGGSIYKAIQTKDPSIEIQIDDPNFPAELIILACPIKETLEIAREINQPKSIIIDIGSVKQPVVALFETLSKGDFIGTHPLAGKEKSGFENSERTLFVEAPWVITPHKNNRPENLKKVAEFIHFLGGNPITLTAIDHDKKAALISHLPGLLAKAYYDFVLAEDPGSLEIKGPGFSSFTRLAHDNPNLRNEISKYNRNILNYILLKWIQNIKTFV